MPITMGSLGDGVYNGNDSTPPNNLPPTSPPPPGGGGGGEGGVGGYACTANQNLRMFEKTARDGGFQTREGTPAAPFNEMYAKLIAAKVEEDESGICNPAATLPNPNYEPDIKEIEALKYASGAGLTIKRKPDGSIDLSDPDTFEAMSRTFPKECDANDPDCEDKDEKKESESGSGSGGGGGGSSGGGGGGGSMAGPGTGGGGGSGGGAPPPAPEPKPLDDSDKAKEECKAKINLVNANIGYYTANLTSAQQARAQIILDMVSYAQTSYAAFDPCSALAELQRLEGELKNVQADADVVAKAGSDIGDATATTPPTPVPTPTTPVPVTPTNPQTTGGIIDKGVVPPPTGAVVTKARNPVTGVDVTTTKWTDPETGDYCDMTETYNPATGATSKVFTRTDPVTGRTKAQNIPAGGNPNASNPLLTPQDKAATASGATKFDWGQILLWGGAAVVVMAVANSGGGKRR